MAKFGLYTLKEAVEDLKRISWTEAEAISVLCTTDLDARLRTNLKVLARIKREGRDANSNR